MKISEFKKNYFDYFPADFGKDFVDFLIVLALFGWCYLLYTFLDSFIK
jgi:hypothetical protein